MEKLQYHHILVRICYVPLMINETHLAQCIYYHRHLNSGRHLAIAHLTVNISRKMPAKIFHNTLVSYKSEPMC